MKAILKKNAVPFGIAVAASVSLNLLTTDYSQRGVLSLLLSLAVSAVVSALLLFAVRFLADRQAERYKRRIQANKAVTWTVRLNNVSIGSLSDAEYAEEQLEVFQDARPFLAQLANIVHVVLTFASKLLVAVPLVLFWLLFGAALLSPEGFTSTLQELIAAGPAQLQAAARPLLFTVTTLAIMSFGLMMALGVRFGFKNHYAAALADRLRERFNTPAHGELYVTGMVTAAAPGQHGRVTN